MSRFFSFGRPPAPRDLPQDPRPDWEQANPAAIERSLVRAMGKRSGGWGVLDASRLIAAPRHFRVAGRELVAWRAQGVLRVAPDACPHMGASLACGRVEEGKLVCPWHGLALTDRHGAWSTLPAHDDGVLAWVRLPELLAPGETPTEQPILCE